MEREKRDQMVNEVISRVINNAPLNEVLRVYSLSVQKSLEGLNDQDLQEAVLNAGYTDILEKYADLEDLVTGDPIPQPQEEQMSLVG